MNNLTLKPGYHDFAISQESTAKSNDEINNSENTELREVKKKAHDLGAKLGTGVPSLTTQNANSIFSSLVQEATVLSEKEKTARDISDSDLVAPKVEDKSTDELLKNEDEEETLLDEVLTNIANEKYEDTFSNKKQIIDQLKNTYRLNIPEATEINADVLLERAILEADLVLQ